MALPELDLIDPEALKERPHLAVGIALLTCFLLLVEVWRGILSGREDHWGREALRREAERSGAQAAGDGELRFSYQAFSEALEASTRARAARDTALAAPAGSAVRAAWAATLR